MEFSVLLTIVQGLVVGVTTDGAGTVRRDNGNGPGAYENLIKAVSSFSDIRKKA